MIITSIIIALVVYFAVKGLIGELPKPEKEKDEWRIERNFTRDEVCKHGTASDVHCCGCHSGFTFPQMTHDEDCFYAIPD